MDDRAKEDLLTFALLTRQQSLYWLTISGYTIGYGDYAPTTPGVRLACVFFLPFTVAVLGELLTRIASTYMDRQQHKVEHEFLNRAITLSDIKNLDMNDDGKVDLSEFLRYMLVALQKVQKEDLEEIVAAFHRLDADGSGYLSVDDLTTVSGSLRRSVKRLSMARKLNPSFLQNPNLETVEEA